jgi:16S rRNA (uracil1498-N3)-methyltransferase
MMLRVPTQSLQLGDVSLDEETSRYVVKVHRKRPGEQLLLFDPVRGEQAVAAITSDRLPHVTVQVTRIDESPRHEMPVTLLCCLGKGDKPEQAMSDVTALGAERLVLIHGERSVSNGEGSARKARLLRVAEQVARQCGRGHLPDLVGPLGLEEYFSSAPPRQLRLFCALSDTARPMVQLTEQILATRQMDGVVVVVGPEGGLSPQEVQLCLEHGCLPLTLGPYVLRAEVAVGAALSTLRAIFHAAP